MYSFSKVSLGRDKDTVCWDGGWLKVLNYCVLRQLYKPIEETRVYKASEALNNECRNIRQCIFRRLKRCMQSIFTMPTGKKRTRKGKRGYSKLWLPWSFVSSQSINSSWSDEFVQWLSSKIKIVNFFSSSSYRSVVTMTRKHDDNKQGRQTESDDIQGRHYGTNGDTST